MKISEITVANVATFLRLESGDYDSTMLTSIMAAAKEYIKSYTGLCDDTATLEAVGIGDGLEFAYNTAFNPIVAGTFHLFVNAVEITTGFTLDYSTGAIQFDVAPADGLAITATYKAGIDAFSDFYIAFMVLCQDMYDNRSMYVDKSNVNKVVECILGMHCVNLL